MADIDAVCFDLDSTLCVSNQSDEEIHQAVFDRVGVDPFFTPADLRAVDSADIETAQSDVEFYTNLYRATVATLETDPDPSLLAELGEVTADVVDQTDVSFRPGAEDALVYASERYEVGLVTNGGERTQTEKLDHLGIADAFDVAVFCDPTKGIDPKPATEPFQRALSGLSATAERTVHIGNDHSCDVAGAHAAGLQSVWVPMDRPHETHSNALDPAPTYRLESPAELSTIL